MNHATTSSTTRGRHDARPRTDTALPSQDWRVIHTYTRAEALAAGVLFDVTPTAKEAGFKVPTAVTASVFNECIEWTEEDARQCRTYQDQAGRLWDVLFLAAAKARSLRGRRQNQLLYEIHVVLRRPRPPAPPHPQARHRPGRRRRARRHAHAAQRGLATPPKDARVQPPPRNPEAQPPERARGRRPAAPEKT